MKTQFSKLAFVATFGLALTLTFGCSSDSDNGNNQSNINSGTEISSSSGDSSSPYSSGGDSNPPSSGGGSHSSSSGGGGVSSSNNLIIIGGQCSVSGFEEDEFIDSRDCNTYKYQIANDGRVWMTENLNYSRNNTLGWCYKTGTSANKLGTAGENLPSCDKPYGRHYTYDIAMDGTQGHGLCPNGWNIPSIAEWDAVNFGYNTTSDFFYVRAGNYHIDASDPLASVWEKRDAQGFYWARNVPEGDKVGYALLVEKNKYLVDVIETQSPNAPNAANKTSDYYSVRCIMDQYFTPTCGNQPIDLATQKCCRGKPFDFATQGCVSGVVTAKCGSEFYDDTNINIRCNGYMIETKCGSEWYDASNTSLRCQGGVIETKCGNGWYDASASVQYCYNDILKNYGSLTYEGRTYKTIEIGEQIWMAENLNYNVSGSICDEREDPACNYGRFYNWAIAMALPSSCNSSSCASQIDTKHQGICPTGWHIPSIAEVEIVGNVWSSSEKDAENAYIRGTFFRSKSLALSIRCVKN
ncbi:MAG: hypothetical protein FWF67_06635 [Fibromonadales bacterium]|nr:hypothetical protein [Fibromonadales bacterium]